jgi:2',3'-cyclic-nucleotide 2'-phosphodiesterase (5'-nucleotidase family)/predicted AlkP superfamily phosphohydrolase/phosphomutase
MRQRAAPPVHRALLIGLLLSLLASSVASALPLAPGAFAPVTNAPSTSKLPKAVAEKVILFGSDGMRPDLVEKYAAAGAMPTYAGMIANGAKGDNGMLQAAPPNTGVGWSTMATGNWPGVHGMTNNTFHRNGAAFTSRQSGYAAATRQAETIAEAAVRQGLKVALIEWPASLPASGVLTRSNTPVLDFRANVSGRGVALNYDIPGGAEGAAEFGVQYDRITPTVASGWTNAPTSYSPAQEVTFSQNDAGQPKYTYNAYLYDSTNDNQTNYDSALISASKDAGQALATLKAGEWAPIKQRIIGGSLNGKMGGFWLKLIDLSPDLARVRFYFTSVARSNVSPPSLEDNINENFEPVTAADFAPMEAHIIDEDTYAEQGLLWNRTMHPIIRHILTVFQPDTDLVLAGYPVTDEFSHQFMALVTPTSPVYDDVDRNGQPDGRTAAREGYIRSAYTGADSTLALIKSLMPQDTPVFAGADHGFAPIWKGINAGEVLESIGMQATAQTSNCVPRTPATDKAKGCWAGAALQIYLNLVGRDPVTATVPAAQYITVTNQIADAFRNLTDPTTGQSVIEAVYMKSETHNIPAGEYGSVNMLHPTRTGDVVVFAKPPYQFDAAPVGQLMGDVPFFGQHGYLPDTVDLANNVNMHAAFFASGPMIKHMTVEKMRAIDIAPTVSYLLGMQAPAQNIGEIRLDMLEANPSNTEGMRLEAEDAIIRAPMQEFNHTGAESCGYVAAPTGSPNGQGTVTFAVTVPTRGRYYIWGRTWAPSVTQDSFYFAVDNQPRFVWDVVGSGRWDWFYVTNRTNGGPSGQAGFNLTAGYHIITVTTREAGARLDALELTRDVSHKPSDTGCGTSGDTTGKAIVELAAWSDFHGQLLPIATTVDGLSIPTGGAPQISTLFKEWRESRGYHQLRLSGGDNVGASPPESRLLGDRPTVDAMNAMNWTASVFGNHEFDDGVEHLKMLVSRSQFDWLAANYVISGTMQTDTWYKPAQIYEVNGVKVGIIGLALPETPELVFPGRTGNYQFLQLVDTIRRWQPMLRAQGAQVIGVVTHVGVERAPRSTAANSGPIIAAINALPNAYVDFVVAGHTHTPANVIVNGTLVVQTTNAGQDLVDVVLVVDRRTGDLEYKTASTIVPYSMGIAQDPAVKAVVDAAVAEVQPIVDQIIGTSQVAIPRTTRFLESLQGDIVADAFLTTYDTDFALINSGGLRADLTTESDRNEQGLYNIRRRHVLAVMPFGNTTAVATYTGAQIWAALEHGVSDIRVENGQVTGLSGRFPQVAGLKFRYDPTKPVGQRVLEVTVTSKGRNEPLNLTADYTLSTLDFLYYGGDGYAILRQGRDFQLRGDLQAVIVENYIASHSPLNPTIEGRIVPVLP